MLTEPGTKSLLPTRQSLLSRLRDWQDDDGWREFFDTYWRLIYRVARQAGLDDATAQDVVQNTFIYLSRRMPKFRYDPARESGVVAFALRGAALATGNSAVNVATVEAKVVEPNHRSFRCLSTIIICARLPPLL